LTPLPFLYILSSVGIFDDLVKNPFCPFLVIPVKAGIQYFQSVLSASGGLLSQE